MENLTEIAKGELMIDYAYPCMMAEKALKDLHNAMLEGKHEEATEAGMRALAEVKLTLTAIKDAQEKVKK